MGGDIRPPFQQLTEPALSEAQASVVAGLEAVPSDWRNRPLALCLSGGVDSSALALIFAEARLRALFPGGIEALHVRHGLRGKESDDDARAVRELCARTNLPLREIDAPVARGPGLEARARGARYGALREAAPRSVLATAHHRGDQAETVVMRLLRGARARGLSGVHPWRDDGIWRPLLGLDRSELEEVCLRDGWVPRFDSSNADRAFHRNRIRLDLLPAWERETPGISDALADLARSAWELEPVLDRALDRLGEAMAFSRDEQGFSLDLSRWQGDRASPVEDPELDLLLERAWTGLHRRPWAKSQRERLISDLWVGKTGRRLGGQGEIAHFGGKRLRVERSQTEKDGRR